MHTFPDMVRSAPQNFAFLCPLGMGKKEARGRLDSARLDWTSYFNMSDFMVVRIMPVDIYHRLANIFPEEFFISSDCPLLGRIIVASLRHLSLPMSCRSAIEKHLDAFELRKVEE